MAYCLSAANLLLEAVDRIAMGWNCLKYPWRMARNFGSAYLKHRGRERRAYHEHAGNGSIFSAAEALLEYHPARTREKIAHGLRAAGLKGRIPPIEFVTHHPARHANHRPGILDVDPNVGIVLIVPQLGVVARLLLANEVVFPDQGLDGRIGQDELELLSLLDYLSSPLFEETEALSASALRRALLRYYLGRLSTAEDRALRRYSET